VPDPPASKCQTRLVPSHLRVLGLGLGTARRCRRSGGPAISAGHAKIAGAHTVHPKREMPLDSDRRWAKNSQVRRHVVDIGARGRTSRPVSRILWCRSCGTGGHPSRAAVAGSLLRPTRRLGRAALERLRRPSSTLRCSATLLALLQVGFAEPPESPRALVVSYTAVSPLPTVAEATTGGLLSVALSRGSPRVGVTHHPALWSPDFPRRSSLPDRRGRPAGSSAVLVSLRETATDLRLFPPAKPRPGHTSRWISGPLPARDMVKFKINGHLPSTTTATCRAGCPMFSRMD
jgi:hypothetical protein